MKHSLIYVLAFILLATMIQGCRIERGKTELRLVKIFQRNPFEGEDIAVFSFDKQNRLHSIRHPDYDEYFYYLPDGKLLSHKFTSEYGPTHTYHYTGNQVDYLVYSFEKATYSDTIFYTYGIDGNIIQMDHHASGYYPVTYTYNDRKQVTSAISVHDSISYTWDQKGNLIREYRKSYDDYLHVYHETQSDFEYDSGRNFNYTVKYPQTFLLIRSLEPIPGYESYNNCLSSFGYLYYFHISYPKGTISIHDYNAEGYPTAIALGDVTWDLTYEEYEPE